jgi:chromosome segregation ATPase
VLDAAEELRALQPQPDELGKLRSQVEEAQRANARLVDDLREARGVIRDLEVQLENGKKLERRYNEAAQEVSRLRGDNESLSSQLSQALSQATAQEAFRGRLQKLEEQNASLQRRITDQAKEFGEVYDWAERADNESKRLQKEKAELAEEVARLRERAEKLGESEAPEAVELLEALLPKLVILRESLGYILRGIQDRHPILDLLARLNQDCELIRHKTTKRVESATGWMERHFSTGQGDEGRLYYSKPDPAGKRYVLVAPKDDQSQSIRRLRTFPVQ